MRLRTWVQGRKNVSLGLERDREREWRKDEPDEGGSEGEPAYDDVGHDRALLLVYCREEKVTDDDEEGGKRKGKRTNSSSPCLVS
jgi:hypothetical protein